VPPPLSAPRGTRDLLPAGSTAWHWLHEVHAGVAGLHGYRLLDTPLFEHTELFERGVGTGTDVVDKEMYTFSDRGGRSMTLRPEGTAGVLRAVLQGGLLEEERPARVQYAGPMFRYDRPQKGRYRQFFQVGVECIGERGPHLDVEVIEVGWRFLEGLDISGVVLQVNSLGDLDDRMRYREALLGHFRPLADQLCEDCRRRLDINPLRVLDCKRDAVLRDAAPLITDSLSPASRGHFEEVLRGLEAAGVTAELNPRLVRGLDYYAHTAFEYWHSSLQGAQNSLGGGGRYDGLAEAIGFPPTPGIGYAFGVERLLLLAAEQGTAPPPRPACDAVVCSVEPAQALAAAEVARRLRTAGVRTVLDAADRALGRKLRAADRLGARVCVIVGPDEVREGVAQVRDLGRHTQEVASAGAVVGAVTAALGAGGAA
jgi:histidyl-tRNA synthetase